MTEVGPGKEVVEVSVEVAAPPGQQHPSPAATSASAAAAVPSPSPPSGDSCASAPSGGPPVGKGKVPAGAPEEEEEEKGSSRPRPLYWRRRALLLTCLAAAVAVLVVVGLAVVLPVCLLKCPGPSRPEGTTPYRATFQPKQALQYRLSLTHEIQQGSSSNNSTTPPRTTILSQEFLARLQVFNATPSNTTFLATLLPVMENGTTVAEVPFLVRANFTENSLSTVQVLGYPNQTMMAYVLKSVVLNFLRIGWTDPTGFFAQKQDTAPAILETSNSTCNDTLLVITQGSTYLRNTTLHSFAEVTASRTVVNLTSPLLCGGSEAGKGASLLHFGVVLRAETEVVSQTLPEEGEAPPGEGEGEAGLLGLSQYRVWSTLHLESTVGLAADDLREWDRVRSALTESYPYIFEDRSAVTRTTAKDSASSNSTARAVVGGARPHPTDVAFSTSWESTILRPRLLGVSAEVVNRLSVSGQSGTTTFRGTVGETLLLRIKGFQVQLFDARVDFSGTSPGSLDRRFARFGTSYVVVIPTPVAVALQFVVSLTVDTGLSSRLSRASASPLVVDATLAPYAEVTAEGSVSVSVAVAEAGGTAQGQLVKLSLPLTLHYEAASRLTSLTLRASFAPVSIRAFFYYRVITIGKCKLGCVFGRCVYVPCPQIGDKQQVGGDWGWSSSSSDVTLLTRRL